MSDAKKRRAEEALRQAAFDLVRVSDRAGEKGAAGLVVITRDEFWTIVEMQVRAQSVLDRFDDGGVSYTREQVMDLLSIRPQELTGGDGSVNGVAWEDETLAYSPERDEDGSGKAPAEELRHESGSPIGTTEPWGEPELASLGDALAEAVRDGRVSLDSVGSTPAKQDDSEDAA